MSVDSSSGIPKFRFRKRAGTIEKTLIELQNDAELRVGPAMDLAHVQKPSEIRYNGDEREPRATAPDEHALHALLSAHLDYEGMC